jgi:hypothetical protein
MKVMTICRGVCVAMLFASPAVAQDQTLYITEPLGACGGVQLKTATTLSEEEAGELVKAVFGKVEAHRYYLIHHVRYAESRFAAEEQHWYVYYQRWTSPGWRWVLDPDIRKHFEGSRLFGGKDVAMLYVHRNVPLESLTNVAAAVEATRLTNLLADDRAFLAAASMEAQAQRRKDRIDAIKQEWSSRVDESYQQDELHELSLSGLAAKLAQVEARNATDSLRPGSDAKPGAIKLVHSKTNRTLTGFQGREHVFVTTEAFGALSSLMYTVAVTKKTPAPVENLKGLAGVITGQAAATNVPVELKVSDVCAGKTFEVRHLPSDLAVTATTGEGEKQKTLGKFTYDNERKYWFDVSFALPLSSVDDLSYDVDTDGVVAKNIEKTDLFAMVNIGLPRNTKKTTLQVIPTVIYGMPITGRPLRKHMVGLAFGLSKVQAYVGYLWQRKEVASQSVSDGITEVDIAPAGGDDGWGGSVVWGINLPIKTVVDLLKGGK